MTVVLDHHIIPVRDKEESASFLARILGVPYEGLHGKFAPVKVGETVKMKKVETGIADSTYIQIRSGVDPGEEVVAGSYTAISRRLKDGAKVMIEKEKT